MNTDTAGAGAGCGCRDSALDREARRLHELGVKAMSDGLPADAARHHRTGLRLLGRPLRAARPAMLCPDCAPLAGSLLISLAHAEAEQGRTTFGLSLLRQAETLVDGADRDALHGQRGLLLLRAGNALEALESLNSAVTLLTAHGNHRELARALLNRSVCALELGRIRAAGADLERCRSLARALDWPLMEAKALHNLGYCELLRGDIPASLGIMAQAEARYRACGSAILPILMVDKARALLAAGLAHDACAELDAAIALFRSQRLRNDQAEAELLRAQAAVLYGDPADARDWARRARRSFAQRGNKSAAAGAELVLLHTVATVDGAQAARLAARLRALGRPRQAAVADLIRLRALIAAGHTAQAVRAAAALPAAGPGADTENRLLRQLALSELDTALGRPRPALRRLRTGLTLLQRRRAMLGSLDLQTGSSALGVELADRGLALALADGAPGLVLSWSERSRGQTQLPRSVLPPENDETAEALAELRHLDQTLRAARDAGRPQDQRLVQRRGHVERTLREHAWQAPGRGADGLGNGRVGPAAGTNLTELTSALAPTGQILLGFVASGGALHALVVGDGRPRLVALGDEAEVVEAARRLSADLDALAGRLLPPRIEAVVANSVRIHAARLTERLFTPLRLPPDGRDLVLVPPGSLSAVPWNLLPGLRGRPITVAPSASDWVAAVRAAGRATGNPLGLAAAGAPGLAAAPGPADGDHPLLLAAPGPRRATAEIDAIAAHYPHHLRLAGPDATVEAALLALAGAPIAHLAAHGRHQAQNVLFSRLELADGPLMAYDIMRLPRPPRHVVLSACEVGRSFVRTGGELLGFAATLLRMGTPTVIAATTRIGDDDATKVMTAYHRELCAGAPPARALAAATQDSEFAAFICLGAG